MTIVARWCVVLLVATMSNRPSSNGRQVASAVMKRTSVRSPAAVRASAICCGSTSTPTTRTPNVSATSSAAAPLPQPTSRYDQLRLDRHVAETPHRFLSYSAAVPDVVDETLFDSCHSHGISRQSWPGEIQHRRCLIVERASPSRIDSDGQYH